MTEKFGLPTPTAHVGSSVQSVALVGAAPIVPVAGQPIPVSQSGVWTATATPPADITATGTLTVLNANVTMNMNSIATVMLTITGTWVATITWFLTLDAVTYTGANAYTTGVAAAAANTAANGTWFIPCAGASQIYVGATAYTSGTATVKMRGSTATFPLR